MLCEANAMKTPLAEFYINKKKTDTVAWNVLYVIISHLLH